MIKPKVGILTLPVNNNYGGIIQLAALYNFIESNGYQVVWIDKRHPDNVIKLLSKKIIESNPLYNIYDPRNFKTIKLFLQQVKPFFNNYVSSKTQTVYTKKELKRATEDFDCLVVGSDQIWRLGYIKENYSTYFLDFASVNQKKIAYAASFGKNYWEGDRNSISKIQSLIKTFNLVSTREDIGVEICAESFNFNNAVHVLDPSFLPELDFYKTMLNNITFSRKIELFNYVLDFSKKSNLIVESISKELNLKTDKIYLNNLSNNSSNLMENWLAHFYYADFVVTDSFHGLVFSIIFNKQFIIIGNHSRGLSRFDSLLNLLDLKDRMITIDQFNSKSMPVLQEKIDYSVVNQKLNNHKEISKTYLLNALMS